MNEGLLVAGGVICAGGFWTVDRNRNIKTWTPVGRTPIGGAPVPGTAGIMAVDAANRVILCDDGARFTWTSGGWAPLPALTDSSGVSSGLVRMRVISAFCAGAPIGDCAEGAIISVDERRARQLMREGRVTPVLDAPAPA